MSQAEDVVHGRICACHTMRTDTTTHVMNPLGAESHAPLFCTRRVHINALANTVDIHIESLRGLNLPVVFVNGLPFDARAPTKRMAWTVEPMGKVRMTQSDKWKVGAKARPCVKRYRLYHDLLRALGVTVEPGDELHFHIRMPPSWSKKKRALHDGAPHKQKPDIDNLVGGLLDGVLEEDKGIDRLGATSKRWTSKSSSIIIIRRQ